MTQATKLIVSFLLFCLPFQISALDRIIIWDKNYDRPALKELVILAADLTLDTYGPYTIARSIEMEQGRAFVNLAQNQGINLAMAGINSDREMTTLPIYFPLARGLLGFRICLVKNTNRELFADINTTGDFRKDRLTIGVGTHWPDRQVLESNDLQTITNPVFQQLFDMLDKGRFDCLPRSIAEIDSEATSTFAENLVIENNLAFIYQNAQFMFVSPSHQRLKSRLEEGILKAKQNGEYKKYFDRHFSVILQKHDFYQRKLLFLSNPNLSDKASEAINEYGIASFSN